LYEEKTRIYLDNASTTPIDPKVLDVMLLFLANNYGNLSFLHHEGRIARNSPFVFLILYTPLNSEITRAIGELSKPSSFFFFKKIIVA